MNDILKQKKDEVIVLIDCCETFIIPQKVDLRMEEDSVGTV